MSMDLMVRVLKTKVGNPLRKLVLIKLADNANDMGECWPSYQHIADQCEIDRSTVRKHIKHLESQGFLRIENREGPKGNSSNLYYLTLGPVGSESTGVGPKSTPVGQKSTGAVGPESTRTSHSSEPAKEPVKEPKDLAGKPAEAFDLFWSAYPNKKAKGSAEKAWAKVKPDRALAELIIAAVFAQKLSADWTKDDGKFIPHPATWLNAKRWEDEVTAAPVVIGHQQVQTKHGGFDQRDYNAGLTAREGGGYAF